MKIKLIESVKPISKYEKNINKYLIPAMADLGYKVDDARTLKEEFVNTYFGTYTDFKDRSIPFELELNTSSPNIDSPYQLFATLKLGGKSIKLGSVSTKDPEDFTDLLDNSVPDAFKYSENWHKSPSTELIKSKDGKEQHTKEEWMNLFKNNQKVMNSRQFGFWWNEVYPDQIR